MAPPRRGSHQWERRGGKVAAGRQRHTRDGCTSRDTTLPSAGVTCQRGAPPPPPPRTPCPPPSPSIPPPSRPPPPGPGRAPAADADDGDVGGGSAVGGWRVIADAAPAATTAASTDADSVAAAAGATTAALRTLATVVAPLPLVAVRAVATALTWVPGQLGVALACFAVVGAMDFALAYRDAAVRRGAASSTATVVSGSTPNA
ncbi:hypothetical protein I4F81_012221 [Pyropia yezoensis]|uniref:Uncharacterized protein n=1 Tax=Pyropia yezoensis TaxID=2788 RepID=A0ACC3CI21_PYRYE|nr:hypothetical protein I4F81_012221 [Neopyropia yezoensis]